MSRFDQILNGKRSLHRDKYGAIGQPINVNGVNYIEGGDSASWNGLYMYLKGENKVPMSFFEVGCGAYVRHPHQHPIANKYGAYYRNPWNGNFTRDQKTGIMVGLIRTKDYKGLLRMGAHWALRGFLFAYNNKENGKDPYNSPWRVPDLTLFDMWATFLRGFGKFSFLFRNLLLILDLQILLTTFYITYIKKEDEHVLNYLARLMVSKEFQPTLISLMAVKMVDTKQMDKALLKYWTGWRDNGYMAFLFVYKMEQLGIR